MSRLWIDPPYLRWGRAWALAAVALLMGLVVAWHDDSAEPRARSGAQAGSTWQARPDRPAPETTPVVTAHAAATVDATQVDICGLGRVERSADDPTGFDRVPAAEVQSAWQRVLSAGQAHPHPRVQAAALRAQWIAGQASASAPAPVPGTASPEADRARDQLARLASLSRDPWVYGWALQTCGTLDARPAAEVTGHCALLRLEQWAQLDARDAWPWMHAAGQARQRGDEPAVAEALHRVSLSTGVDVHRGRLSTLLLDSLPTDTPPLARTLAMIDLWRVETRASPRGHEAVETVCSVPDLRHVNRRQLCASVAEQLLAQARTVPDLATSAVLGQRLGWPTERLAALRAEQAQLEQAEQATPDLGAALGCAGHRQLVEWATRLARVGEVAALRERSAR